MNDNLRVTQKKRTRFSHDSSIVSAFKALFKLESYAFTFIHVVQEANDSLEFEKLAWIIQ